MTTASGINQIGLNQLISYFEKPENHFDRDTKHVSRNEFIGAIGNISAEADKLIYGVIFSNCGICSLRALQTEGLMNDEEVSLRDLHAARRGTGFNSEALPETYNSLKQTISFYCNLPEDDPVLLFLKNRMLATGAHSYDAIAQVRAMLAIAGPEATARFKDLQIDTGLSASAQVRAMLAIAGPEATTRFKGLQIDTGLDASAQVRAMLAIAGPEATTRFKDLQIDTGLDASAQVRAMLAIAGPEATARFKDLQIDTGLDASAQVRAMLAVNKTINQDLLNLNSSNINFLVPFTSTWVVIGSALHLGLL